MGWVKAQDERKRDGGRIENEIHYQAAEGPDYTTNSAVLPKQFAKRSGEETDNKVGEGCIGNGGV